MDHRQKESLIFPAKVRERDCKFNLVSTNKLGFIGKPVGQETDTYDEVMLRYMRNQDRGTLKPIKNAAG